MTDSNTTEESDRTSETGTNLDMEIEDPPIFDGSGISLTTFNHMFVGLAEKHNMSRNTQSDMLSFLNAVLP